MTDNLTNKSCFILVAVLCTRLKHNQISHNLCNFLFSLSKFFDPSIVFKPLSGRSLKKEEASRLLMRTAAPSLQTLLHLECKREKGCSGNVNYKHEAIEDITSLDFSARDH